MPELPDIVVYVERVAARVVGQPLEARRLVSPFLLRTVDVAPRALEGRRVREVLRLGKRLVIGSSLIVKAAPRRNSPLPNPGSPQTPPTAAPGNPILC